MKIDGEEFFEIPGYHKDYVISKSGRVYSFRSGRELTGWVNEDGYVSFGVEEVSGKRTTVGRHRLLCIAFKPIDLDLRDLVVNHLNGIPGDDRLENLEWTTYLGNIEHAGLLGLTTKCMPCSVMDVDTGEIVKYPSAIKAARALKLTKESVLYRLRFDPDRVYPERKQYRLGWDDKPWPVNPDPESSILEYGKAQGVLVKNLDTGEVKRYHALAAVSKEIKFSMGCLSKRMKKESQPWFPPNLLLKWETNKEEWRETIDKYVEYENCTISKVVILVAEDPTKNRVFYSAKHCADEMGVNHTTVLYRVNSKTKPRYDGYEYHYYSSYRSVQLESNP